MTERMIRVARIGPRMDESQIKGCSRRNETSNSSKEFMTCLCTTEVSECSRSLGNGILQLSVEQFGGEGGCAIIQSSFLPVVHQPEMKFSRWSDCPRFTRLPGPSWEEDCGQRQHFSPCSDSRKYRIAASLNHFAGGSSNGVVYGEEKEFADCPYSGLLHGIVGSDSCDTNHGSKFK